MIPSDDRALLARRNAVWGSHTLLFYDEPLHLVRGEGVWLHDSSGRRFLDAYNNTAQVGHCHPHVVAAIAGQAGELNTHTRYLHEAIIAYSERLAATFDPSLSKVVFTCTGSEANEIALRVARFCSGARGIIVSDHSYHGNTAALSAMTTAFAMPEALAPDIRAVRIPDCDDTSDGDAFVESVRAAVASLRADGHGVAALLLDTVVSTEGMPRLSAGALGRAVALVREAGGIFVADEVQGGFGRMGDGMWGFDASGLVPDIVTLGKPMGNGHPVGGAVVRSDLWERFGSRVMYFNTFAGNPVSAAAAAATLDVIEREGLIANARAQGEYLRHALTALAERHPPVGAVRGRGLYFGIDIVDPDTRAPAAAAANRLVNMMRERGVLVSRSGRDGNFMKVRPPLVLERKHGDLLIAALDDALGKLRATQHA